MITQNISLTAPKRIMLGRREENEATQVVFDISYFIETFGEGTATLLAKRSKDVNAYPVAVTQENETVTWLVSNADTAYQGQGQAELMWFVGDVLAKSVAFPTWTDPDIGEEGEVPEPYESWVTQLLEDIDDKNAAAQQIMDGKVSEAQGYANEAKGYKNQAKNSADAAAASATQAAQILDTTVYVGTDGKFYIRGE